MERALLLQTKHYIPLLIVKFFFVKFDIPKPFDCETLAKSQGLMEPEHNTRSIRRKFLAFLKFMTSETE